MERATSYGHRRQVYVGEVRKCPLCGMELPNMVAICPGCGYELNSQQVNPVIAQFADKLSECDQEIAIEENSYFNRSKSGWASWSALGKIGWVILNMYTLAIPLVLYQISQVKKNRPQMPASAKKAAIIENFQIPDEKGVIIEFIYFIQTKVTILLAQREDGTTLYWLNLWQAKAKYVYDKTQILLTDNQTVSNIYKDIVTKASDFKRRLYLKKVGPFLLIPIFALALFLGTYISNLVYNYDAVEKFTIGYEKADFSKFNSPASQNGLGDTKIYIEGRISEIIFLELSDSDVEIAGYVIDDSGNVWLASLNSSQNVSLNYYNSIINMPVVLRGTYLGFSAVYEVPGIVLNKLLVKDGKLGRFDEKPIDGWSRE